MNWRQSMYYFIFLITYCLVFGVFGVIYATFWTKGLAYTSEDQTCPKVPNITNLSVKKQLLDLWNWKYEGKQMSIDMTCPSVLKDANVYVLSLIHISEPTRPY